MKDLLELFDSLLIVMVSFPITLYYVLVSPEKVIELEPGALISPAGVTLLVSFIIWYTSYSMQMRIKYNDDMPSSPSLTYIVKVFILIILLLLIQYLLLLIPSLLPSNLIDPVKIVKYLSYPVSVGLTVSALVYMLLIILPIGNPNGKTIVERFDKIFWEIRKKNKTKRIVVEENAQSISSFFGILTYIFSLYNIIRVAFHLTFVQAILPSVVLLLATVLFLILFGFLIFDRLDKLPERLRQQDKGLSRNEIL